VINNISRSVTCQPKMIPKTGLHRLSITLLLMPLRGLSIEIYARGSHFRRLGENYFTILPLGHFPTFISTLYPPPAASHPMLCMRAKASLAKGTSAGQRFEFEKMKQDALLRAKPKPRAERQLKTPKSYAQFSPPFAINSCEDSIRKRGAFATGQRREYQFRCGQVVSDRGSRSRSHCCRS
jgi:hypothetical protein